MSDVIDIVKESQLDKLVQADLPVLVDFWAPWCGPCKAMMPIVLELAKQYADKVVFVKVNIDQLPTLASKYQVGGIPYLVLFKKGTQLADLTGLQPQAALSNFLVQNLHFR